MIRRWIEEFLAILFWMLLLSAISDELKRSWEIGGPADE